MRYRILVLFAFIVAPLCSYSQVTIEDRTTTGGSPEEDGPPIDRPGSGDPKTSNITSKVYPNPTQGVIHIEATDQNQSICVKIYKQGGKEVYKSSGKSRIKKSINLLKHGSGRYYVNVLSREEEKVTHVVIVK